jgi:hypothetical protein
MNNFITAGSLDSPGAYTTYSLNGLTGEEFALQYGLPPELWAAFDMNDFPAGAQYYPGNFYIIDNLPSPNTVDFDFAAAQAVSSAIAQGRAAQTQQLLSTGYDPLALASQASLPEIDREATIQSILTSVNGVAAALQVQLAAISAATTLPELVDATYPTSGVLFTGRGAGLGPEDLNVSYYKIFSSITLVEADTELYIPGTATVIPYGIPIAGEFDSLGDCFAVGDYLMQIREASTSSVIAEFECPLNLSGEYVAF